MTLCNDSLCERDLLVAQPCQAWDAGRLDFLDRVSSAVTKDKRAREYPDLMTMAYFCRSSSLKRWLDTDLRCGIGAVFHLTPNNVPLNFFLSFLFGFVSGNSNLVKVPVREFPQVDLLLDILNRLLDESVYRGSQRFIRESHSSIDLAAIFQRFDGFVVWGGDTAVESCRCLPRKMRSRLIEFPDRYSLALISAGTVLKSDPKTLRTQASRFVADVTLFDQNACSSPKGLCWLGAPSEIRDAKKVFWKAVDICTEAKEYFNYRSLITRINNIVEFALSADEAALVPMGLNNKILRIPGSKMRLDKCKHLPLSCGMTIEFEFSELKEFCRVLDQDVQTLSAWIDEGSSGIVEAIRVVGSKGVDRVVQFGETTSPSLVWDGIGTINALSREFDVLRGVK